MEEEIKNTDDAQKENATVTEGEIKEEVKTEDEENDDVKTEEEKAGDAQMEVVQAENTQSEPKKKKPYNTWTYIMNHTAIIEAFMKFIKKRNRRPTTRELRDITGLSLGNINKHMKDFRYDDFLKEFKMLTPGILLSLYNRVTEEGKAPEVKLWMQIIEGWTESHNLKHAGKIQFEKINFVFEQDEHKSNESI